MWKWMLDRYLISFSIFWCAFCVRAMCVVTSGQSHETSCYSDYQPNRSRRLLSDTAKESKSRISTEHRIKLWNLREQRPMSIICRGYLTETCTARILDHDRNLSARDHSNRLTSEIRFGLNDRDRSMTETISGSGSRMPDFRRAHSKRIQRMDVHQPMTWIRVIWETT
jgi:hypothetical protein